ncbi:MAG: ABC transporter permease [Phycisphaerales bacterium]|nr:ABC transporter permease [Phycisphaerales bacterium]MCI0629828.1 ABC transporter permease [Phycisphaerales bacterium]
MIGTVLRIGWLNLKRDRVALVLTFVLPIVFFSIFAVIFGGLSGGDSMPKVELVVVDEDQTDASRRFVRAIQNEDGFKGPERKDRHATTVDSAEEARNLVKEREIDAALVIPKGFGESFGSFDPNAPPITLYADDVANPVAHQIVTGLLQKIAMTATPDLAIERGIGMFEKYAGALTPQQRAAMDQFLPELRTLTSEGGSGESRPATAPATNAANGADDDGPPQNFMSPVQVRVENVQSGNERERKAGISYQAAGIGVMFLLFSMAGAMGALLQEASSGTLERVLSSRLGMTRLLLGNWMYAALAGFAQLTVMFLWGWLVFGLELWTTTHVTGFIAMTAVSAAAAAAFGLMLGTACRSAGQLQGISTVVILCMSAVGGSMIPRFLLKQNPLMDVAGLFTFNGWALDGYQKVFWDDKPVWQLWPQLAVLAAMAIVCLALARQFARRWEAV